MDIANSSNPKWTDIVTGKLTYQFKFLGAKILLGHLLITTKNDSSPETIKKCATDLRELFHRNTKLPSVQEDLKKIFG